MALVSISSDIGPPQSHGCSAVLSSPPHIPAPFGPPWLLGLGLGLGSGLAPEAIGARKLRAYEEHVHQLKGYQGQQPESDKD